jgi:PhnB protein
VAEQTQDKSQPAKKRRVFMSVKPIPDGYHSVTPYLIVDDAAAALDFYRKAFGAEECLRMPMGEKIGHAEISIGDSRVMLSDEWPVMGLLGPKMRGGATASLMIYLDSVDSAFERAIKAGATVERPVENQFYGDRSGTLIDPFGHRWTLSTHVEDVTPEEMERRMEALTKSKGG